jgi:hypothetical protein
MPTNSAMPTPRTSSRRSPAVWMRTYGSWKRTNKTPVNFYLLFVMPTYLDSPDPDPRPSATAPDPPQEDPYSIGLWPARPGIAVQPPVPPPGPNEDSPLNPMIPAGLPTGPESPAAPGTPIPPGNPSSPADHPPSPTYGVALWHHFQRTPGFVLPPLPSGAVSLPPMYLTGPTEEILPGDTGTGPA